jgi:hypothetical protein
MYFCAAIKGTYHLLCYKIKEIERVKRSWYDLCSNIAFLGHGSNERVTIATDKDIMEICVFICECTAIATSS